MRVSLSFHFCIYVFPPLVMDFLSSFSYTSLPSVTSLKAPPHFPFRLFLSYSCDCLLDAFLWRRCNRKGSKVHVQVCIVMPCLHLILYLCHLFLLSFYGLLSLSAPVIDCDAHFSSAALPSFTFVLSFHPFWFPTLSLHTAVPNFLKCSGCA